MNKSLPKAYGSDLSMDFAGGNGKEGEAIVGEVVPGTAEVGVVDVAVLKECEGAVTSAEAEALELTEAQRTAIVRLTSGMSYVDAATAAGVSRMTLYRWLNHDPAFQAAYNAWQRDVLSTAKGQMVSMTRDAMATVMGAIRGGDAKLAWKLLESQGVTEKPTAGPTDVEELKQQEKLEMKKREIARMKEKNRVEKEEVDVALEGWGPR